MSYIICISIIALLLLVLLLNIRHEDREKIKELEKENEAIKDRENDQNKRREEAQKAKQDARTGDHASDLNFIAQRLHKHATSDEHGPADN